MNVKMISKALHTLSLMSDEDYDLVLQLRALTEDERGLLMAVLEPSKPAGKTTAARKIEKCEVCNYTRRALQHTNPQHTEYHEFVSSQNASKKSSRSSSSKSPRATGIEQQLSKRREQGRAGVTTGDNNDALSDLRCSYEGCGWLQEDLIHDPRGGYTGYHPFQPAASPAPARSPANGGATNGIQNSEAEKVVAGAVAGGSSE